MEGPLRGGKCVRVINSKLKGKIGAAGQDTTGDNHPINMARKVIDLDSTLIFCHENDQRTYLTPELAEYILFEYASMKKPDQKEGFIKQIWSSRAGLDDYIDGIVYPLHEPPRPLLQF